jgi:cytochrome P450
MTETSTGQGFATPDAGADDVVQTAPAASRRPRDPFKFLMDLVAREGAVARYRAGTEPAFLVTDPDLIKRVLADNAGNYSKATQINGTFKRAVADGLLTSEGPTWRRQRRLMQPAFHRDRLAALSAQMTGATVDMLERWSGTAARGEVVNVSEEMSALTLRITVKALFGTDVIEQAANVGHRIAAGLSALVSPEQPAFIDGKRAVEELLTGIIAERQQEPRDPPDLLQMLMDARDAETGEALTRDEILDQMMTLLLAGYETTANSLAWSWYLLSQNPGSAARLRAELAAVLGGRVPTVADLPLLPYNRMVLEEAMRLYPPAWILGRRALADDDLGGHAIPAGSVVAISPYLMHRQPDHWDDPEAFDPERFTKERSAGRKPFAYFPFGGGPRLCIGHNFAMLEAQLIVATVAQRFELHLVPGHRVEPERLFVLRPRGGLPMLLEEIGRPRTSVN